ncbi:hypothetical protein D3C86_1413930 [compost metagenome]
MGNHALVHAVSQGRTVDTVINARQIATGGRCRGAVEGGRHRVELRRFAGLDETLAVINGHGDHVAALAVKAHAHDVALVVFLNNADAQHVAAFDIVRLELRRQQACDFRRLCLRIAGAKEGGFDGLGLAGRDHVVGIFLDGHRG